jgi:hypothetical protein
MSASGLEPQVVDDMTLFVTGGWAAVINKWLIEAADPLDVQEFSHRLKGIFLVIVGAATSNAPTGHQTTAPDPAPDAGSPDAESAV